MTTTEKDKAIENRMINFLLLNAGFSDKLGLMNGKSAAALYLFHTSQHTASAWPVDAAFSLLEEAIMQIGVHTPLVYGYGIAGIGGVLEYLNQGGYTEQDTNELLADSEPYIFSAVYNGRLKDVSIASGLAGLGLYMLHRLAATPPADPFTQLRLKEGVISCVDQVNEKLTVMFSDTHTGHCDLSVFHGISGALLWLNQVRQLNWYEPVVTDMIKQLLTRLLNEIRALPFSWEHAGAWCCILHCAASLDKESLLAPMLPALALWGEEAGRQLDNTGFHNAAWYALWLRLISYETQLPQFLSLSKQLTQSVQLTLRQYTLPELFPFNLTEKDVPMGLHQGVCGIAMPLFAMERSAYQWLSLFGWNAARLVPGNL